MPLLIAAIIGALAQAAASIVGRVLLALFISYVTFKGFDTLLSSLIGIGKANVSALPAEIMAFIQWCWVDKAINMIASAYTAAMVIKTANSGNLSKMVFKK